MAGETALARQLKKLAVPQTTLLIQDKIRKSFLFDHRDAAGLDRDIIFAYGTNGLEKLCLINPNFSKFESNLFSLSYKDFERSVQSKDVNAKLDLKIAEFLKMLSPYFLIRGAHEALEWLVYRFHIQMFNVDDLVASALPYYNTSTFVRVVQLLDLDEGSRWDWLKPIQKSGIHLEYSAILNRFLSDGGFRKFVCNIAPNVVSVYQNNLNVTVPIVSFSMLTVYNALAKCQSIDDKLITMLFPYIVKGLKSDLIKYVAATYLVISQIVVKVQLASGIIENLMDRVFQSAKEKLISDAFRLLLLVFQNQRMKSLPKTVQSVIVSNQESVIILSGLTETFDACTLSRAVMKRTLIDLFNSDLSSNAKIFKRQMKFLKNLLNVIKLDQKSIKIVFNLTIKKSFKYSKKVGSKTDNSTKIAKTVFNCLEKKYPDCFDRALKIYSEKNPKLHKKLYSIINASVCSLKHKTASGMETSFVIGLNHANPKIRKTSVHYLIQANEREEFAEKDFLANSLYDRLLDDNPDVVETVLSHPNIILKSLDMSKVLSSFEEIFKRNINLKSPWYSVLMKCLRFIAEDFSNEENVYLLLPFIIKFAFPVNENSVKGFSLLLHSNLQNFLLEELKLLKPEISEDSMNEEKYISINCKIVSLLKQSLGKLDEASISSLTSFLSSKLSDLQCCSFISFYLQVMEYLIIKDHHDSPKYTEEFLQILRHSFSISDISADYLDDISELTVIKKFQASASNELPVSIMLFAFKNIIIKTKKTADNNMPWPDTRSQTYRVLGKIFDFCILSLNSFKRNLKAYFKNMLSLFVEKLKNTQNIFKFLCINWMDYKEEVPQVLKLSALQIALSLCEKETSMDWLFQDDAIFFCLLSAISDPNPAVSHLALDILSRSLSCSKSCHYPLKSLAEDISFKNEEIKVDHTQCFTSVGNYVKPATELLEAKQDRVKKNAPHSDTQKAVLEKILMLLSEDNVPHSVKLLLLMCLRDIDCPIILSACVPLLQKSLSNLQSPDNDKKNLLPIIKLSLKKFNAATAKCVLDNSNEAKALFDCLRYNNRNDSDNCVQKFTLRVLSKDFFSSLPSLKVQQDIFHVLLELYMDSSANLNSEVAKTLRKLCTYAYIFLKHFLEKELNVSRGSTLREAKKSRTSENFDASAAFEKGPWKKMTVFLELMQNKSKLLQMNMIIPDLFNLLNKSLDLENQATVEYIKQLILSVIFHCCQLLGSEKLDERQFQVELVVQCIRSSTNVKTHQQSLLLLNLAARMFPDYVLSNIMSIFTFMGSSLVRQDDSYSFQVISQTIESIVPSLLEASNLQTESSGIQVVASVIRVFVDSLADIPSHRQLPLFTKLLSTLDPSKYLWIPISQICDQYATVFYNIMTENSQNWKISPALEFAVNLHKQFSPDIQIDTCIELANLLATLPDTKRQLETNPERYRLLKEPFNVSNHDDKQLQAYKYNVLSYVKIWLSSQEFFSQVSELNAKEQHNLEVKYELLLEAVLKLLQDRLNMQQSKAEDGNISNQIQILYDLVHTINSLLPCNLFIRMIRCLLKNSEIEIRIKAVEFLNAKLEQLEDLQTENKKALLKLLRPLLKLVETCMNDESENNKTASTLQAGLYSLHLLCKLIGRDNPSKFHKVLNVSIRILTNRSLPELMVNALLCLAQLCSCLNVDILPQLNQFMPVVVNILQDERNMNMNECLILGMIAAMLSIIENLGKFLSSYLEDIITGICVLSVKFTELKKKNVCEKFQVLQTKIANEIALRVLLTAVQNSYLKITSKTAAIAVPLMKILTEKLNSCSYEDILASATELQKFYLSSLEFRNCSQDVPLETINNVEDNVILSFKTFVMKLSVTRFRTLFRNVYQWATTSLDDQEQKLRVYTFYKLTCEFSKSLKSLFSHMSMYFFRHIVTVLDSNNLSKSDTLYFEGNVILSYELLCNCIDTLNSSFMFAEDQFLDPENFEILLQPLVDQIENSGFESHYQDLIESHLGSCIANFMAAVSDNTLWKSLNYQILLKTRHSSPKVRFGSLQVIQEVVTKMGDNYLVLLPESIPFLAEILEDESTEVEQECQNVIIEMEKILGEPIRNYLSR